MAQYFINGESVTPNKNELLMILLYLKGVFAPETFCIFETDYHKRDLLVDSLDKPFLYMDILSEKKDYPDFSLLESNMKTLKFTDCAQYMMFYLRLAKRHSGGDTFIAMWKSGVIERLVERMLQNYDSCTLE